jgi:hypothetical protein
MCHDPKLVKPYAEYHAHARPMVIVQAAAREKIRSPQKRIWKVSQYVPIVEHGLAASGSYAVAMLNLSGLRTSSSPALCLAWAHSFCQALEGGVAAETAAAIADRHVKRTRQGDADD